MALSSNTAQHARDRPHFPTEARSPRGLPLRGVCTRGIGTLTWYLRKLRHSTFLTCCTLRHTTVQTGDSVSPTRPQGLRPDLLHADTTGLNDQRKSQNSQVQE